MARSSSPDGPGASQPPAFRCLFCAEARAEPVFLGCRDYYLRKPYRVDYYRCARCRVLQQHPVPADVSAFYEDYPIHRPKSFLYDLGRKVLMSGAYFDPSGLPPGARLLDYGCGDGSYLATLKGRGLERVGFESDAAHAARLSSALGVPVESDAERLLRAHEGTFDAVAMHHVLEHVTDPEAAFASARRLLRPGGTFYAVLPQPDSPEARLFGRKWHHLDPPRHVSFPDAAAIGALAERHGFTLSRHAPIPLPTGFAASLTVAVAGRFVPALFYAFVPLGIVFSRLSPTGYRGFWLSRRSAEGLSRTSIG